MHSSRRTLLSLLSLTPLLAVSSAWAASPGLDELIGQLKSSTDFRVRVSAALQLGKSLTGDAAAPLETALDDPNASVRAAAAAALKNLGDLDALGALGAHRGDKSEAVRAQVASAIKSLEEAHERAEDQSAGQDRHHEERLGRAVAQVRDRAG